MGFKTSALLLSPADAMSEDALRTLCDSPGGGGWNDPSSETAPLDEVFNPAEGVVATASFDGAAAIFNWNAFGALADVARNADDPRRRILAEASAHGAVAYVALHSVTNYYAIALWREGGLARLLVGAGDRGDDHPALNEGAEQAFERTAFQRLSDAPSAPDFSLDDWRGVRDGPPRRYRIGGDEILSHDMIGEEMVFALFEEMIGHAPHLADDAFWSAPARILRPATRRAVASAETAAPRTRLAPPPHHGWRAWMRRLFRP